LNQLKYGHCQLPECARPDAAQVAGSGHAALQGPLKLLACALTADAAAAASLSDDDKTQEVMSKHEEVIF